MNRKNIIIIILSILLALTLGLLVYYYNKSDIKKEFYVRVKESNASSSIVEQLDSNKNKSKYPVLEINVGDLTEGDILKISYDDEILESYPPIVKVNSYEYIIKKSNNTNNDEIDNNLINEIPTTTKITTTTTKTISNTNNISSKDNIVLTKLESNINSIEENINNKSFKEKAKDYFINTVDFIFYDKDIKGIYFKDLTNKAKLKTIELTLKLDNLIEKHYPEYKDNISNKYQDIKSKLITLYLDKTSEYCANHLSVCDEAKTDFALFKNAYGITWDYIKNFSSKGFTKLKEWYEIYSSKSN